MAIPEGIVCPVCKAETEIWSDEQDATCHSCGCGIATKYSNKGG
jgi:transcription initiation factor TFIIIB Brf1 subunit/transcription initiation factor TFIIB